jgi:hypothetical protein
VRTRIVNTVLAMTSIPSRRWTASQRITGVMRCAPRAPSFHARSSVSSALELDYCPLGKVGTGSQAVAVIRAMGLDASSPPKASAVFHSTQHVKPRPCRPGVVANPRDTNPAASSPPAAAAAAGRLAIAPCARCLAAFGAGPKEPLLAGNADTEGRLSGSLKSDDASVHSVEEAGQRNPTTAVVRCHDSSARGPTFTPATRSTKNAPTDGLPLPAATGWNQRRLASMLTAR